MDENMTDDEWEAAYEAAAEHRENCHDGWVYPGCPLCDEIPAGTVIQVRCFGGCNTTIGMTKDEIVLRSEDEEIECLECATGITAIRKCRDCEVVLAADDQFTRTIIHDGSLMRVFDRQTVCLPCYMDNPGSGEEI